MAMLRKADFHHKVMLVNVNKCWDKPGLDPYDAVRYSWSVARLNAEKVQYVLAVKHGEIKAAFEPSEWLNATRENFSELPEDHGNWQRQEWRSGCLRLGFRGRKASPEIQRLYVGNHISKDLRGQGIRYVG